MAADPIKVYDARWEVPSLTMPSARLFEATFGYAAYWRGHRHADAGCAAGLRPRAGNRRASGVAHGLRVFARMEPVSTPQVFHGAVRIAETSADDGAVVRRRTTPSIHRHQVHGADGACHREDCGPWGADED